MEFTQDQFFQAVAPCKTPRIWIAGIAICGQRKLYHPASHRSNAGRDLINEHNRPIADVAGHRFSTVMPAERFL